MIHIVLLGLTNDVAEKGEKYALHRLLGTLFSQKLEVEEKLNIIRNEYDIPVTNKMREDVNVMCNLSEAIEEEGYRKGIQTTIHMVKSMYQKGYSMEEIMDLSSLTEEQVKEWLELRECEA